MIFSKGFLHILFRALLIVGLAFGLTYSYLKTDLLITPVMFGLLILLAVMELTWRLHKQERTWEGFLMSIKYHDFNRVYQRQTIAPQLSAAYELITESMEALQTSREAEFQLLETVLGHVSMAVVCYNDDGEVIFTNKAFDQLLEIPGLIHIDRIQNTYPKIYEAISAIEGVRSEWVSHTNGQQLSVKVASFKRKGKGHKLISLTDIRRSLDTKELESYQKLMRVMTHEIMNSATPILSLVSVVNKKLIQGDELIELGSKDQRNIAISLQTIEKRTSDMLKFVEAYKQINRSIAPQLAPNVVKLRILSVELSSIFRNLVE